MNRAATIDPDLWADVRSRDRHRLQQRARKAGRVEQQVELREAVEASAEHTRARRACQGTVELAAGLPITARADDVRAALVEHQVVVVCGETGSGKTTQLPKILMQAGFGARGRIGHTQPRRLAARSVAERIAAEMNAEFGGLVGFATRFDKQVSEATQIKLMTDGILLAETARDRFLNQYEAIIIDEAHERTLNVDFILGYLKQLLPVRSDLKVIVTSATIDPERFAAFFNDASVVNVEGRGYPVSLRYRPPEDDDADISQAIESGVRELWREGPGDILVFLPGERDIRDAERHLSRALAHGKHAGAEIVPLYARLTRAAQNRIFSKSRGRRVVLATNVAETSLTVPGIRYVIDTGLARISRYSTTAKIQRLPIEPVSQASCNQRAGRCGRIAPGICIRLFDEDDYTARPAFTDPEIRRTNLANVLLTMADLRLGAIEAFPFIDPPERRFINDGRNLLIQLQAMDDKQITATGRRLARLPLDPRIGRMLLAGEEYGVPAALRVLAAGLSVQDPRERPAEAREAADQAHRPFADNRSDFVSLLKLWDAFAAIKRERSGNQLRKWCRDHFLNFMRMREWEDLVRQLRRIGHAIGLTGAPATRRLAEEDFAGLHSALLTGLIDHVGQLDDKLDYQGVRGRKFRVFPGSGLAKRAPKWIVAGELIETSRLFAHTVAGVEPRWIERAAAHLVKHEYHDPHWEQRRGQVAASERVKLFGLTLADGRKRDFGAIDPKMAREIFIRDGLVAGAVVDKRGRPPRFLAHNQQLIDTIAEREARFRRRDLLVDETTQERFYAERLPSHVCDRKTLQRWLADHDEASLYFTEDALQRQAGVDLPEHAYPERLTLGDTPVALDYAFEPGHERDGATARVPLATLNQLPAERAAWGVPGLLEEKYREYLRALPKKWRKAVVPVPDFARAAAEHVDFGVGDPETALRSAIRAMTGLDLPDDVWENFIPSEHLRLRFEVVDEAGTVVAAGRDLDALRAEAGDRARQAVAEAADDGYTATGLTGWPDHDLPSEVELSHAGARLRAIPALVDRANHVDVALFDNADRAANAHRQGVIRLARLAAAKPCRLVKRDLVGLKRFAATHLPPPPATALAAADTQAALEHDPESILIADLLTALIGARLVPAPRERTVFDAVIEEIRTHLMADAVALWQSLEPALASFAAIRKRLSRNIGLDWMTAVEDINDQLAHLVYAGFISQSCHHADGPVEHARHLQRYLAAIEQRIDKLAREGAAADKQRQRAVMPYWQAYKQRAERAAARDGATPELVTLRWMVEEYRVSIFAQPLGTAMKVSAKRLDSALEIL